MPEPLFPPEAGLARVWQLDPWARQLGGSSMLNGSECPNDAVACSLSLILEASAHPRFCLSARAARGILRRAAKRGRMLPAALAQALRELSGHTAPEDQTRPTLSEGGVSWSQTAGALDGAGGGVDDDDARAGHLVVVAPLTAGGHPGSSAPGRRREDDQNFVAYSLRAEGHDASEDGTGRQPGFIIEREQSRTLTGRGGRLDGDSDTFVLSRDADAGQRPGREPDAGSEVSDRGDGR